jgi:hypothetical protein
MEKLLMLGRRRLWTLKNFEPRYRKDLEEAMNENLAKEQKSQEQQLRLWKDRPRVAKEEIPNTVFQTLQKQHSIGEDDAVGFTQDPDWPAFQAPPGYSLAAWNWELAILSALVLQLMDEEKK